MKEENKTGEGNFIEEISRGNEAWSKIKKIVFDRDTILTVENDTDFVVKPVITFEGEIDKEGVVLGKRFVMRIAKEGVVPESEEEE